MYFDYRTKDSAYNIFLDFLGINGDEYIQDYVIECGSDNRRFLKKYASSIRNICYSDIKFILTHITTSSNGCFEIEKNGLLDLRTILSKPSEISTFLSEQGIAIDVEKKKIRVDGISYDINFNDLCSRFDLSIIDKKLKVIAHKLEVDFPIWGFYWQDDHYGGSVDRAPEIIQNINSFCEVCGNKKPIEKEWRENRSPYEIAYEVNIDMLDKVGVLYDACNNYGADEDGIKLGLFSTLIDRFESKLSSHSIALLKPGFFVSEKSILSITPYSRLK